MIQIEIKKSKKVFDEMAGFISFDFNSELLRIVKSQPTRIWHPDLRQWEIPAKNLGILVNDLKSYPVTIVGEQMDAPEPMEEEIQIPEGFQFKTEPFGHQIEGFQYGMEHESFLLGDEQGLGKTKQAIDIAVAKKITKGYKHCLIICGVNGLKWNWEQEIRTHSDEGSHILGNRMKSNGKRAVASNKAKLEDLQDLPEDYFLITNVESLRNKEIMEQTKELIGSGKIEMVVVDEIHKCKNPASQQGKSLLQINPQTRMALTGTPLMNTPMDLYIILKWLGFEKHSFYQFKNHYCIMGGYGGYEVVGYKNLNELQSHLDQIMIRRLKKDVLDLPEKIHSIEYVEMGPDQLRIYKEVQDELQESIDKILISPNPLAQLIRLRQATGYTGILSSTIQESAKIDRLEEIVEELVESGEKAIIFSNWTDITDPIYQRLRRFNPAVITGQTKDREAEKNRFMSDPSCKVIIGTIGAMGTGLTLTAAQTVIFMDSPWNRANKEQAEDRAHRIGTIGSVNIITLVCKDTIDERIEDIIHTKGKMSDAIVDQEIDLTNPDTIRYLLG